MGLFRMKWEYFTLKNGVLVDEDGNGILDEGVRFSCIEDAERYLHESDIRGSVRDVVWSKYESTVRP